MLLSSLIGALITSRADPAIKGSCVDFFLDLDDRAVIYILAHLQGADSHRPALLRAQGVSFGEKGIIFDELTEADGADEIEMSGVPLDIGSFPPLVVGPFGFTYAPALVGALFNDVASGYSDIDRPDISAEGKRWHWFSHLVGLSVFDVTNDLGTLVDIETRGADMNCQSLIVAPENGAPTGYPFWMLRDVARGETNIKLESQRPQLWSADHDTVTGDAGQS